VEGIELRETISSLPDRVVGILQPDAPVVVTGCAGFIGSTLTEALLAMGCAVTGVDCLTDYYDVSLKRENMAGFLEDDRFTFVEADLQELDAVGLLQGKVACFHLAAQAGVRASWGDYFQEYLGRNVMATQRLLEACLHESVRNTLVRFVYSSSSSVYGNQPSLPVTEQALPQPRSPYGVTKMAAEHLCVLYAMNFGVPTSSLRYFTVYGPRQRPDMAFRKFIEAALDGRAFEVYGDGSQTRDFTYVADAVRSNLLAVAAAEDGWSSGIPSSNCRKSWFPGFRALRPFWNIRRWPRATLPTPSPTAPTWKMPSVTGPPWISPRDWRGKSTGPSAGENKDEPPARLPGN